MHNLARTPYDEMIERIALGEFTTPHVIHRGSPLGIEAAMKLLGECGFHGACDAVEGAVWRVERDALVNPGKGGERKRVVDFVVKYVRPDKRDGIYLPEMSGGEVVWNCRREI